MTVLIVEDYDDTRELLDVIFSLAGHVVLQAADGESAVRAAERHSPDAIVMDLSLPVCDGLTAARRIKALRGFEHVPIVAHTAKTDPFERGPSPSVTRREDSLFDDDLPFAAVLTKPCPPDILVSTVESHVSRLALARTA